MRERTLRILHAAEELAAFAPAWRRLWWSDARATPFQSPEWLLPWWRQFGEGHLCAGVLMEKDEPLCFLPLYIYVGPGSVQRKMMLLGVGTSDYLDGIFGPACSVQDVLQCLDGVVTAVDFDVLSLVQLRAESKLLAALRQSGAAIRSFSSEACSRMPATRLVGLPQKIRRNAMYYRNRARREGELTLELAEEATCAAAFEELVRMHTASWQQRGEAGVVADARVLAWHCEAIPLLQRAGLLRLGVLRLDDVAISAFYALADPPGRIARKEYFYLIAYSPEHAGLRPGNVLLAEAIEQAALDGIAEVDMLRGEEGYKKQWHVEPVPTVGVEMRACDWRCIEREAAA